VESLGKDILSRMDEEVAVKRRRVTPDGEQPIIRSVCPFTRPNNKLLLVEVLQLSDLSLGIFARIFFYKAEQMPKVRAARARGTEEPRPYHGVHGAR
jgi:hypothetical protein